MDTEPKKIAGPEAVLTGGGEVGALMAAMDWSQTDVGPIDSWPEALRTAVSICLGSRFPICMTWGAGYTTFYNDAYTPIMGDSKHPRFLGRSFKECWAEVWDVVGPMIDSVLATGQATYSENLLLLIDRRHYAEEAYFTFSYGAIRDSSAIRGMFCAVTETTESVVGERQLALLRDLATATGEARTIADACTSAGRSLETDLHDLPFAMLYRVDAERGRAVLAAASNIVAGHPAAPQEIDLEEPSHWPLRQALRANAPCTVSNLESKFGGLPAGAWDRPPKQAVALPIAGSGQAGPSGILVAGLNPYRLLDDSYSRFLGLVAGQIAAAIANAQVYEEERKRAEALAELDRAKMTFFSNVSHEFRTPLTLLLGPLEDALAAGEDRLPPEQRERLTVVQRNALRLLRLVNTLLDFSRIEAGRVQASFEATDLPAYTADMAANFRSAIEQAGMSLIVDCPALPDGMTAYVDREMWEKILLNLLSNAFKFTFEGAIAVSLRVVDGHIELEVRDTGTGISAHELPRLFDRFHRVQGARSRTNEGTGIGLALVQELVKLHGGDIRADSVPGQGTTFTLSMPAGAAHLPVERIGAARSQLSTTLGALPYIDEALSWLPEEGSSSRCPRFELAQPETRTSKSEAPPRSPGRRQPGYA